MGLEPVTYPELPSTYALPCSWCGDPATHEPVLILRWPRTARSPAPTTIGELEACGGCAGTLDVREVLTGCVALAIHAALERTGAPPPAWELTELRWRAV